MFNDKEEFSIILPFVHGIRLANAIGVLHGFWTRTHYSYRQQLTICLLKKTFYLQLVRVLVKNPRLHSYICHFLLQKTIYHRRRKKTIYHCFTIKLNLKLITNYTGRSDIQISYQLDNWRYYLFNCLRVDGYRKPHATSTSS